MEIKDKYKEKLINPDDFIELVKPGNKIFLSSGPAAPARTVAEIKNSTKIKNFDLEIIQLFTIGDLFSDDNSESHNYRLKTFRTGESASDDLHQGKVDFIPVNLIEIPFIFSSGIIDVDIAVITTSPPDKRGFLSLGTAIDVASLVIKKAGIAIVEINPNMPVTYGETSIHIDQVDYIIESDIPLIEREIRPFTGVQDKIGWHISNLIQDGSTVALHVGRTFDAVAHHLKTKKNLGIFTNVISDWVIDLIEAGAISLERRKESGGQISVSYTHLRAHET